MSRTAGVLVGYGIDLGWEGEFIGRLEDVLGEQGIDDLDAEALTRTLKNEGLDVTIERYGHEYKGVAMFARDSVQESLTWTLDLVVPLTSVAVPQWRRELVQAIDVLGWEDAGLDNARWLVLASYG